jgi:lysophospholipase L1-like esterase
MPLMVQSRRAFTPLPVISLLTVCLACLIALIVFLAGCGSAASPGGAANSPGAAATATMRPTYVFVAIGASETFGEGADRPATQNWPTDFSVHLPSGAKVVNLGIPGATAQGALQGELPAALDSMPNLVTVWLGTNDVIQQVPLVTYQRNLDMILTQLVTKTKASIAVANLPNLNLLPRFANQDQAALKAQVKQWNDIIAQEVTSHHLILVDIFSQTSQLVAHPEYLSGDGLHPSTLGYRQIANFFYQVLHANGVI